MGRLKIVYGNILDNLKGHDLIVNSANKYMICGSGVCGAIYKSANKELLEKYCKNNYVEDMKINDVRITPGFDLGIDILHIYCPKAYENNNSLSELIDSYIYLFIGAEEKGYKSIISVSIGTGVHGYKHSAVANNVISILNDLVYRYNINFTLVLPNEEIMKLYKDIKLLSLEEFNKLSSEEKGKRYIELSPNDKYIVRLTDYIQPTTVGYMEVTKGQRKESEERIKKVQKMVNKRLKEIKKISLKK